MHQNQWILVLPESLLERLPVPCLERLLDPNPVFARLRNLRSIRVIVMLMKLRPIVDLSCAVVSTRSRHK